MPFMTQPEDDDGKWQMKLYNTRFHPTVNGPLHLGHLYNILINRDEAYRSGGKFGIRYDDLQRYWNWKIGPADIEKYKHEMIADLEWLGIKPDWISSGAELKPVIERLAVDEFCFMMPEQPFNHGFVPEVIGINLGWFPYAETLTAESVLMDMIEGCNWIIRGWDLLSQDSLYHYFCDRFCIGHPRTTYIPRLTFTGEEVSKTKGKYKISDFRQAGMDPGDLLCLLGQDCLERDGWYVENIKDRPALSEWAMEALNGLPA